MRWPAIRRSIRWSRERSTSGCEATQRVRWNAGYFRADNRDDILFVMSEQTGFGYFRNFGRTRRQGFEVGADGQFGPVTLGVGYTLLDATFQSPETLNGESNSTNEEAAGRKSRAGRRDRDRGGFTHAAHPASHAQSVRRGASAVERVRGPRSRLDVELLRARQRKQSRTSRTASTISGRAVPPDTRW